jgi:lysophospholipase L1-like esterase
LWLSLLILGDLLKRLAVLTAAALVLTGCAAQSSPPVSAKVQDYYNKNVANRKATTPTTEAAKKVAFIGDSYTAGSGASSPENRWTTRLATSRGWEEINLGSGGTGYLVTSKASDGSVRKNYQDRIVAAVKAKPDVVLVTGGGNDLALNPVDVVAAVRDFYPALRKALPEAQIIAVNPLWGATEIPAGLTDVQAAVKSSVSGVGGTFVDIGQPLVGHPELVIADKVHPNDQGAGEIAALTDAALTKSPAGTKL